MAAGTLEPAQELLCKHPAYPKYFAWFPSGTSIFVRYQESVLSMVDSPARAINRTQIISNAHGIKKRQTSECTNLDWGHQLNGLLPLRRLRLDIVVIDSPIGLIASLLP